MKRISNESEYQGLELTNEQCARLFAFVQAGFVVNNNQTLVHPLNMDALIVAGLQFDLSQNLNAFAQVKSQLLMDSLQIVRVLYEYCRYLAENFSSAGYGDAAVGIKAKWASTAIAENFLQLYVTLKPVLQMAFFMDFVKTNSLDCPNVVANSLLLPEPTKIANFCGGGWSETNLKLLGGFCAKPTTANYQTNQKSYFGFTFFEMNLLCDKTDDTENSMGFILNQVEARIAQKYGCEAGYCSAYTLAHMQMTNSSISASPPPSSNFPPSSSIKDWFPDLFPQQFELKYFLDKTKNAGKLAPLSLNQSKEAFFWDNLFSPLPPAKAIALRKAGDNTFITGRLHFSDPLVFEKYINFMALQVYLGGPTYTGKVCDLIFGFSPEVTEKIRLTPPLFAGDPSTPRFVALNENNTYLYQTRYTGKANLNQVGSFYTTNNLPHINAIQQFWDGAKVRNQTMSPWAEKVPFQGGDGGSFTPHCKKTTSQAGFISDLYRAPTSSFAKEVPKSHGLQAYRFIADQSTGDVSPETAKFYQFKYKNLFNLTKARRAPVFLSKMMFKDSNQSLRDNVKFFNEQRLPVEFRAEEFEGWLDLEPRTGVPVDISVNFQVNLDMSSDLLLDTWPDNLVPVFQIRRTMVLSDSQVRLAHQVSDIFGSLLFGLKFTKVTTWVAGVLAFAVTFLLIQIILANKDLLSKKRANEEGGEEELYRKMKENPGIDGDSDMGLSLLKNTVLNKPSSQKQSTKSLLI